MAPSEYQVEKTPGGMQYVIPGAEQIGKLNVDMYTYNSVGGANLETMKRLAVSGEGLNGFINMSVKKRYASKRS